MLKDKKILHLDLIPILLIAFIMYRIVNNFEIVSNALGYLLSILSYFIWGFSIAYFLNPLMSFLERRFNLRRIWSMLTVYSILIGTISFLGAIIIPKMLGSLWDLVENIPRFIPISEAWVRESFEKLNAFDDYDLLPYLEENLENILNKMWEYINIPIENIIARAVNFTSGIVKFIFGSLLSVYLLKDKEKFITNNKRFIKALFSPSRAAGIIQFGQEVNTLFSSYIVGKFVDSAIIGILCFIGLLIIKSPFALLISIIVGVTNMIPYFGPFIGMIPSTIIVLFYNPVKALWVFSLIFLLQQFDGWVLGPKILGDHVGLSPFWIIMAVLIGGGVFGIWGMFLGVPIVAMIKIWLNRYIDKRLDATKTRLL